MPIAITKDQEMAAHWKTQIEQCEQEYHRWYERCKRISQRYRDERVTVDEGKRNLNLFWSNVQTLKPAVYSKTPVPICERRFLDKDTVGRVASTILERGLRYEVAMGGFDSAVRRSRLDYLVVGRGQVWIRYNPEFGESVSPKVKATDEMIEDGSGLELEEAKANTEVIRDSLCVDYTHWEDYFQLPAGVRTEEEIEGKARRIYMSRQDMIKKFGKKLGKAVPLDHTPQAMPDEGSRSRITSQENAQATIYEIWWKPTRKVYFIAKEYDKTLMEVDDPLNLEGFFPCPPALQSTVTNDTMIPVPDYAESQDQYVQIDNLTKRIDVLTSALKVVGVYDASAQSLKRVFEEGNEPNLIPVDSWAMFAEKGGLKGAIDFVPIKDIADTLQTVIEVRAKIIEDLDRVTGIWDIMRGTSDARETMGAQRLKQNNGSQRLQERQDDMSRFCRDIISIMGELIAEHFSEKTLIQVSGALYDEGMEPPPEAPKAINQLPPQALQPQIGGPPQGQPGNNQLPVPMGNAGPPQVGAPQPAVPSAELPPETEEQKLQRRMVLIQQAIDLLRQDKIRGFRIDIETDSTIQGDAEQEKASRIQFVEGVTQYIKQAGETAMLAPEFLPLAGKMLQFAVRGFRVGRDLESAIEEFVEKAELDAKQAALKPKPPSPEQLKAEETKAKIASDQQMAQAKMESDKINAAAELQRQQVENEGEQRNAQLDYQTKILDVRMKEMEIEIAKIKAQADIAKTHHERHKMDTEAASSEADLNKKAMDLQDHHKTIVNSEVEPIKNIMLQIAQHVQGLHEHANSPVEFTHGLDGKLSHVKKGNQVLQIHRNPQGKPARLG